MIGRVILGRYEAQKLLGEGGMGKVYLARQLDLNRSVVIKVMHEHVAADAKFRERFQRESQVMARFTHPSAVTLYDAAVNTEFGPCIVMEYVRGINLEKLLQKNGRLSTGRVYRVLAQLCDVLQAAHDEGILHRDLKPANIMISEPETPKERVKVMDFGLAKLLDEANVTVSVTDTNVDFAVGTPGYIAPEQIRGENMDHRGDLYSVGVMLFELLTGRLPFQGSTSMDVLLAHATESPPTMNELGMASLVPRAVEQVLRQTLEKDPALRPQSARELAAMFAAAMQNSGYDPHRGSSGDQEDEPILLCTDPSSGQYPSVDTKTDVRRPTPVPSLMMTSPVTKPQPVLDHLRFELDAWMPESIAVMKMRGFVHDTRGSVTDSSPGCIHVRFPKLGVKTAGGALGWLGVAKRTDGPVTLEVHVRKVDPKREPNRLQLKILFRPQHLELLQHTEWQLRANEVFMKLRAYMMG